MLRGLGLTQDQIYGELYVAWLKDIRERPTNAAFIKFKEMVDKGIHEKDVVFRKEHIEVNMCITLSSLLSGSNVTKVDLYGNLIRDTGCEAIAHLLREAPNLIHLNIGANDIGPQGVQLLSSVVATHRKLQILILGSSETDTHSNRVDGTCAKVLLDALSRSRTLKMLDLNRNPIGRMSQEAFPLIAALIQSCPTLQVLKLGATEMQPESGLQIINAVAKGSNMSLLDLHGNYLTHHNAEAFGKLLQERTVRSAPHSLKTILLQQNPLLGERGAAPLFRPLVADKSVSTLNLHSCNVDDEGLLVLCNSLLTNTSITHLDLHCNLLTEEGIVELARSLLNHPALTSLNLGNNKVKDEGACALASMLESNHIIDTLDLDNCWVGDRGIIALGVALASNRNLTTLTVTNNHISEDGGTALAALLEKNRSLQHCKLKGNSMYHCTVLQANRIGARNRWLKQDEIPSQLRKERTLLDYQMAKLDEAKKALRAQKDKKEKIDTEQQRHEAQYQQEETELKKKQKDLKEAIQEQESRYKSLEEQIKKTHDELRKDTLSHEGDMVIFKEKYDAAVKEREKVEEEFKAIQEELENAEALKQKKIEDMKRRIEEAKVEKERWAVQTKELRAKYEETQQKVREFEGEVSKNAEAVAVAKAAKEDQKKDKKEKKGKGSNDIAALLAS